MGRRLLRVAAFCAALGMAVPAWSGVYEEMIVAANEGRTSDVIALVQRGMDPNTADRFGNTLLLIAARSGNNELLDFLLRIRANALKRNKFGDSAIMVAAYGGQVAAVKRLLDAHVEINNDGWTPLHYAAFAGHAEIVRLLIERGADTEAAAPNGQTALILAARAGRLDAVRALVDGDADIDGTDYEGETALQHAAKAKQSEVVEYLRSEGAEE